MRALCVLIMLGTAAAALAADDSSAASAATATFSLKPKSDFAIRVPADRIGKKYRTDAKTGEATVDLDLRLYFAKLPYGYTRSGETVYSCDLNDTQLANRGAVAAVQKRIETAFGWPACWMKTDATWGSAQSSFIADQDLNLRRLMGNLVSKSQLVNGAQILASRQSAALPESLDKLPLTAHVEVFPVSAPDGTTSLRMGEGYVVWHLQPKVTLTNHETVGQLISLRTATARRGDEQKPVSGAKAGNEKPAPEEGGGKADDKAKDTETSPAANPDNNSVLSCLTSAGFTSAMLRSSPGYDVVGGVAVARSGPQGMAGVVASFVQEEDKLERPWDWRRLGLLGGRVMGADASWVIGPSYRIGPRAHLFGGAAFGSSDNNTSHTWTFGLAYSASDVLDAVSGRGGQSQSNAAAVDLTVAVEDESTTPLPEDSVDLTHPRLFFCPSRESVEAGLAVVGPHLKTPIASPPDDRTSLRYDYDYFTVAAGEELLGAWGCSSTLNASGVEVEPPARFWSSQGTAATYRPAATPSDAAVMPVASPLGVEVWRSGAEHPVSLKPPLLLLSGEVYFVRLSVPAAAAASEPKPKPVGTPLVPADAGALSAVLLQSGKDGAVTPLGQLVFRDGEVPCWYRGLMKIPPVGESYCLRLGWTNSPEAVLPVDLSDKHPLDVLVLHRKVGDASWRLALAIIGAESVGALEGATVQLWQRDAARGSATRLCPDQLSRALPVGSYECRVEVGGREYSKVFEVAATPVQ